MARVSAIAGCSMLLAFVASLPAAAEPPPAWAYPVNPPGFQPEKDSGAPRRVPNSTLSITLTQVRDLFYAPDWHPEDHPPMPDVVANGRKPDVLACGSCHRADGSGGPENANLTGLTVDYMARQLAAFRAGARNTSEPRRTFYAKMIQIARAVTDEEFAAASRYFASVPYRSMVDVVEADMVPKTRSEGWHLSLIQDAGTEPIGERIIEVPVDNERFTSRDSRVRFIAYVPQGSIARGRVLATTGGDGRTAACSTCHGADLKGTAIGPAIIGRSPSFVVRQLYDIQAGNRTGANAAQMKPIVEHLTLNDMIALAAYTSSLKP